MLILTLRRAELIFDAADQISLLSLVLMQEAFKNHPVLHRHGVNVDVFDRRELFEVIPIKEGRREIIHG
jgi:hypothetical protein